MSKQIENFIVEHGSTEDLTESISHESLDYGEDDIQQETHNSGLQRKVTNPFRLRQMARAKAAAEEGFHQELSKASATKESIVQPPPKAVFIDLHSAYQSITARSSRARAGTVITRTDEKAQGLAEAIPAYDNRLPDYSIKPLNLYGSKRTSPCANDFEDIDLGPTVVRRPTEEFDIDDQAALHSRPSVLASVKSYFRGAIVSIREPQATDAENLHRHAGQSLKLQDGSSDYHMNSQSDLSTASVDQPNRLPHEPLSLPKAQFSSSPSPNNPWLQARPVVSGSPTMERSTVGEIYREYETARSPLERPAHCAEKGDESQESEDTSYGDSEILLEGRDELAPPAIGSIRSENTLSVAVSTVPSLTEVNWRHRYSTYPDSRLAREESFKSMYSERSRVNSLVPHLEEPDQSRLPLEREISQELRRASAISEDSFHESNDDMFQARDNACTGGRGFLQASRAPYDNSDGLGSSSSLSESDVDTVRGRAYQEQPDPGFYNQDAIAPQWVGYDQEIRVPIKRPEIPPRSPRRPPPSASTSTAVPVTRRSHEDEWQTIGGSAWETESRATSSHGADTSGDGISRLSAEGYGSTERIAQHPAPISGSSKYLRRDVAGKRPVLLPVPNDYLVNGYPANSSRVLPAVHSYQGPTPLRQQHENPFSCSPPEVLSPEKSYKPIGILARARNLFPVSNSTMTTDDSGTTARRGDSRKERNPVDRNNQLLNTTNWMRNPANFVVHPSDPPPPPSSSRRPSSFEFVLSMADSEEYNDYRSHSSYSSQRPRQADGAVQEPREVIQGPRIMQSCRDAPAGEFKYRSPLAPPKARIARELYTDAQLLDIEQRAGHRFSPTARIVSTASQGPSQRCLDEPPALNHFTWDPTYERDQLKWNRVGLALCALFLPFLLCMGIGAFDNLLKRKSKGRFEKFQDKFKKYAVYAFFIEFFFLAVLGVMITIAVYAKRPAPTEY